ncbi:MAG TPA: hypothetical protein VF175_16400 [Lacipirellula sp.]
MARAVKYIALLGMILAAVSAAAGAVATQRFGDGGYLASVIAALLVWIVGGASLALIAAARTPAARLNCILAGILVRISLPLVAVVYFTSSSHPLAAKGIAGLIVVHYLAGLIAETLMALRLIGPLNASASAAGAKEIPAS